MRYIVIPEPVVIEGIEEKPTLEFQNFVLYTLLADKSWRQDDSHVNAGIEISEAVRGKKAGEVAEISNEAWDWLKAASKEVQINPSFAVHVLKLVGAITGAKAERPRAVEVPAQPAA